MLLRAFSDTVVLRLPPDQTAAPKDWGQDFLPIGFCCCRSTLSAGMCHVWQEGLLPHGSLWRLNSEDDSAHYLQNIMGYILICMHGSTEAMVHASRYYIPSSATDPSHDPASSEEVTRLHWYLSVSRARNPCNTI